MRRKGEGMLVRKDAYKSTATGWKTKKGGKEMNNNK